jgi:hypothetical protein
MDIMNQIKKIEERLFKLETVCKLQNSEEEEYYKYLNAGQRKEVIHNITLLEQQINSHEIIKQPYKMSMFLLNRKLY